MIVVDRPLWHRHGMARVDSALEVGWSGAHGLPSRSYRASGHQKTTLERGSTVSPASRARRGSPATDASRCPGSLR